MRHCLVLALGIAASCDDFGDGYTYGYVDSGSTTSEADPAPADGGGGGGCDGHIVCNDGTCSPSCTSCSQGCCSSHDGCL